MKIRIRFTLNPVNPCETGQRRTGVVVECGPAVALVNIPVFSCFISNVPSVAVPSTHHCAFFKSLFVVVEHFNQCLFNISANIEPVVFMLALDTQTVTHLLP